MVHTNIQYTLGKGPKQKCKFMVFDHNRGGVSLNHTLIAKLHCFLKHYIHLNYTQFVVVPK